MPKDKQTITIIINNKAYKCQLGQTVLEVVRENNIDIPALCYHPELDIKASCRLCLVQIKGSRRLHTACSTKVYDGMMLRTESPEINKARKVNLELIFAQHCEECNDCILQGNCKLLKLAREYQVEVTRFPDRKKKYPKYSFGPAVEFDSSKCIDCRNCVEICAKQAVGFLDIKDRGYFSKIVPNKRYDKDCIYCGQCITHCPVGAFEAVGEFEDVAKPLANKRKTVVFQFAPSIRTSLGEEFGLAPGTDVTGQMITAIRELGADKVFDVVAGADFTTVEEAKELKERLQKNRKLPLFTSCCPAWVKFVEFYYPKLIPHLTTVRSPHMISGGLIKSYWAKKAGVKQKDVVVVSVMPCVAKKYEITRKQFKVNGMRPVDYVLTTREFGYLLKKNKINLPDLKSGVADSPFGEASGAGVIYGASGGVMESALRTAFYEITGENLKDVEFKQVRGQTGAKKAIVKIKDKEVKVAVVNGISNAVKVINELKKNPKAYDYVEVMACFGGCIGGGGQPVPVDNDIRQKRASALYRIDARKRVRQAHENKDLKEVYKNFLKNKHTRHDLCHTSFSRKKREVKSK